MKDNLISIVIAFVLTNLFTAALLDQQADYITKEMDKLQTIIRTPAITATPTPDAEKIGLRQEVEKLRQDNITLSAWKQDLEGFLEAQIRR